MNVSELSEEDIRAGKKKLNEIRDLKLRLD